MKRTSRLRLAASAASLLRVTTRSGGPTLVERANAVPRLVRATATGRYLGVPAARLALVVAAVAYVLSPVDLLPELVLPVVGLADDALVVSWAVRTFLEETDRFLAWELGQGLRQGPSVVPGQVLAGWTRARGPDPTRDRTGAASGGRIRSGGRAVRGAASDYVAESLRRRLEP
ncbi:MAG: DUF1232 domain-containing protein [Intrasporangium sp.]|uniref:YkvA family protein n=1 Tax=Intrasporangium sp. TaxID=1925024 RepID=UPI0026481958|nr:YkvA family protein [Intrasporangium sp.]MDN5795253.1 DUF1232 domain-containing protein [Intrasporangium sp.]